MKGKKFQSCPKPAKIAAELTAANVPKLSDTGTRFKEDNNFRLVDLRFDDTVTDEKKVDDPKNPPKLEAVKPKVKSTERRKLESND